MITGDDVRRIAEEVIANHRRRNSCALHYVEKQLADNKPPTRTLFVCKFCKGTFDYGYLGPYLAGYEAAGGDPQQVWPDASPRKTEPKA
jgi:hypothetical protein